MKFSSIAPRVFLPIPLAFGISIILGLVTAGLGLVRFKEPAALLEPMTILVALLYVAALQLTLGLPSVQLLRRRSLLVYMLTAVSVACVIGAVAGILGFFESNSENTGSTLSTNSGVESQSLVGMLCIAVPALVLGYAAAWWRFTIFPRRMNRRRKRRIHDSRRSLEDIPNTEIPNHVKAQLPEENTTPRPIGRLSKKTRENR